MKNTIMILQGLILLALLTLSSCYDHQIKFDKINWNASNDPAFPPPLRKAMLKDLITNYKLVGFTYSRLINTIGKPDIKEDYTLGYRIEEDYGSDIDPIYSKDLIFYFSKDSIITSYKVSEWKK